MCLVSNFINYGRVFLLCVHPSFMCYNTRTVYMREVSAAFEGVDHKTKDSDGACLYLDASSDDGPDTISDLNGRFIFQPLSIIL